MILDPYAARACPDDGCIDKHRRRRCVQFDVVPVEGKELARAEPGVDEEVRDLMQFV